MPFLPRRIETRRAAARDIRAQAAQIAHDRPHPGDPGIKPHESNKDEALLQNTGGSPSFAGNYSKGLPHLDPVSNPDRPGQVEPGAYALFLRALATRDPGDFEQIPEGLPSNNMRFVNPQAGLAFDLEGPDAQAVTLPPAPALRSDVAAAEMVELYWMALLRDVPFDDYASDPLAIEAAADLVGLPSFTVTSTKELFRSNSPGSRDGRYVSQFLLIGNTDARRNLKPVDGYITYGTQKIDQRHTVAKKGLDFMTDVPDWLAVQNGKDTTGDAEFKSKPRFIYDGRDLATYVHFDQLHQAYFNAGLWLLEETRQQAIATTPPPPVEKITLGPGNPYLNSSNQTGFGTFGGPALLVLISEVATRALKAVWFQKWFVHRRLRPEAFGARVHFTLLSPPVNYGIDPLLVTNRVSSPPAACPTGAGARVLDRIYCHNEAQNKKFARPPGGTYLLPQAFPEGSPTHPCYGAGHATVAGACVTILKAWFDMTKNFPAPVEVKPGTQGAKLQGYTGTDVLTIKGELNKLAANIAIGRNIAGVHYFSDYTASRRLGEEIAIGILQEFTLLFNEEHFFCVERFDGTTVVIRDGEVVSGVCPEFGTVGGAREARNRARPDLAAGLGAMGGLGGLRDALRVVGKLPHLGDDEDDRDDGGKPGATPGGSGTPSKTS